MLTLRQKRIIKLLTESRGYLKVVDLSKSLEVSSRTIRYDLDEIDYFLKQIGETLDRRPRVGIGIKDPDRLMTEIIQWENTDHQMPYLNREERLLHLGLLLITANKPVASEVMAEKLGISRSAILMDLKELKQIWSQDYDIELVAKKRYGYQMKSDEFTIRHLLGDYTCRILELNRDGNRIYEVSKGITQMMQALDVQKIRMAMKIANNKRPFWIPYNTYLLAVSKIFVIQWRIETGNFLKPNESDQNSIKAMGCCQNIC